MFPVRHRFGPIGRRRQRGVVLVVALIFLVLLTLLALTSSGSSLLQEKMVGGTRNMQLANFGAESALRAAEARLWKARTMGKTDFINCGRASSHGAGSAATASACYKFNPKNPAAAVEAFRTQSGWQSTGAQTFNITTSGSAALARQPVYIIQDMGLERPPGVGILHESGAPNAGSGATGYENHIYRITARSVGGNNNVVRVVESTFAAKAD